jgi:two-component system, chemotaxis family, sensor kinase CheA
MEGTDMSERFSNEPMLELYIFETAQNIEQLESLILDAEKLNCYTAEAVNEIFRIMHTIKGSSAMMLYNNIAALAHSLEDLFYFIREQKPNNINCSSLSDLILEGIDFMKAEILKIKSGDNVDGECSFLTEKINGFLHELKLQNGLGEASVSLDSDTKQQYYISQIKTIKEASNKACYKATVFFEEGCEMENIRCYTILHNLKEITEEIIFFPEDIIENDDSAEVIRTKGFEVYFKAGESYDEMHHFFMQTIFLRDLELIEFENDKEFIRLNEEKKKQTSLSEVAVTNKNSEKVDKRISTTVTNQSIISVQVSKLDKLMDLVGEMVIAEAMVTQNPDLKGLELDNFNKAARQLRKITSELQDMVMSIRMVTLSTTFHKMHRIVRDMSKKLDREVELQLVGEETEVDKNIIEQISDPLMHLVRNSIDHGIEAPEGREAAGKSRTGIVTLEARNAGSDVLVIVRDDGKGLNKEKILQRARANGLLIKSEEEMTDKEIYGLIFLPGFSTKENVTEFSGRGVGMDVVVKNIESVGGSVSIDSSEGVGSITTIKIPLTLAIIDGMNVRVGSSRYTIPITAIRQSFRPKEGEVFKDPEGNEMIMVRGQCYPVLRLNEYYNVKTEVVSFSEGILIMVEQEGKGLCIFADELIGQQQVVVKSLPGYIKKRRKIEGLSGCTLLGDGCISLILDVNGLLNK